MELLVVISSSLINEGAPAYLPQLHYALQNGELGPCLSPSRSMPKNTLAFICFLMGFIYFFVAPHPSGTKEWLPLFSGKSAATCFLGSGVKRMGAGYCWKSHCVFLCCHPRSIGLAYSLLKNSGPPSKPGNKKFTCEKISKVLFITGVPLSAMRLRALSL